MKVRSEKGNPPLNKALTYLLGRIELFELYLKTFEGMVLFNIAIWNTSSVADKDISIDISVNTDTAEIVPVDETLIHESLKEIAGLVYSEKIIEPLLSLKESADICDGSDYEQPPISAFIKQANVGMMVDPFGYAREPQYDIEDYVEEIQRYLACPFGVNGNEYSFHVSSLRPNEKKWIGKGILLKNKGDDLIITYRITSEFTDGKTQGELCYHLNEE